MKMLLLASALFAGCTNILGFGQTSSGPSGAGQTESQCAPKVSYLCVGMETSARFGACPGCELDAKRLSSLLKTYFSYEGELLISGQATKATVVAKLKEGLARTPADGLFLFFYSGHGGQESLGGKEPDGADRPDEFLCLYDTYLMDDEIWNLVCTCKGRVFLYFDACHSATMYRSVASEKRESMSRTNGGARALAVDPNDLTRTAGFTFRPEKFVTAKALDGSKAASPRLRCWSGCKEAEYSYGGNNGGTLTLAVINNWSKGISYGALWEKAAKNVNAAQKTQHPVETVVGDFPTVTEAFR